jgi:hypothetical protein
LTGQFLFSLQAGARDKQPHGEVDGGDSEAGEEQVEILECDRTGEPAEYTPREVLQPEALKPAEGKLLKPREEDNPPDKDSIGEKVNQFTDSTIIFNWSKILL